MNPLESPEAQAAREVVRVVEDRMSLLVVGDKIDTPEQYQAVAAELVSLKKSRKVVDDRRKAMTGPLDETKRQIMDLFRPMTDKLDALERRFKDALLAYDREQERKAAELRRKAAEEQRQREEEAERERRFQAQRAARLAEQGKTDQAHEAAQAAAQVVTPPPAPVVMAATPAARGIAYRTVYRYEVEDLEQVPREYLMLDERKVRQVVDSTLGQVKIAGLRIFEDKIIAAGRR